MDLGTDAPPLHAWRHPRADGAEGRCIGRSDVPVPARRAKRLAHRIRQFARRNALPQIVVTSALRRSRDVGRWLARWCWRHHIDAGLGELDFGRWDGQPWSALPRDEIDAWCAGFEHHAPGGGEPVAMLLRRVQAFDPGGARIVVTHGGWLSAARWLAQAGAQRPRSQDWPAAPAHGEHIVLCARGAG